ncbi:bifunctional [glutamate--ammonia ligase]-adenylyl-L-tyrosine phosphorylase/[glutamate--ammonia-ligase] adenylyltransferase [Pseudoalteromonas xiamenensis]|uniref:Bifunctional glutamine synthetase adenylyltransferase/adenylyl-removing enzyme n=1 Tax=Pseudoalteromonas xiamenensis TaxID=882626 RepID=A0A975HNP6_9GAMM|nr:bifunctional [glutamate--ammonia ligase]-adenylyl-L-tyrosine phosphorylase/[glutamate--ammonia-ligase] adenylyltransferase [Pseudoalteromonas xiamenensis]
MSLSGVNWTPQLRELSVARMQELDLDVATHPDIARLVALSDFAHRILKSRPELVDWLEQPQQKDNREIPDPLPEDLDGLDDVTCSRLLRRYRQQYWLKVMWLDLVHNNAIDDSVCYVSLLAEKLIDSANRWAFNDVAKLNGMPMDEHGNRLPMLVLGMGKLGGQELNFSSDIDLIFAFPRAGDTQGGRRSIENQVFYTKVAQKLIAALNQTTADGQVFRVDMRLRPFGDSGPLVMSFAAMEDYYQDQGREWERYAMLKGRLLGEPNVYWQEFYTLLRPFVYRRYIDFSVIESLRKMKHMIAQEVRRKGLVNNIKLGGGGIREVEFIVQALQMIRGGREKALQVQSLLVAMNELERLDIIPSQVAAQLRTSYLHLRRIEQFLQAFDDKQTQTLPDNELDKARLVVLLDVNDWNEVLVFIEQTMAIVREEFKQVIGDEPEDESALPECFSLSWEQNDWSAMEQLQETLKLDWQNAVMEFRSRLSKKPIGARGRDILDKLMPRVLAYLLESEHAISTFERVTQVIEKVASRTTYLELLYENQGALQQLIKLCAHSKWIGEHIARYPILLDELIDPALLYRPLPLTAYKAEVRQYFLRLESDDLELQMESLRQFKQTQQLRIAAADATGVLDLMKVSDHLTTLAEAIVEQAVNLAWEQMVSRFGKPEGTDIDNKGFAVIAYGKTGGFELGYDSDLDLVFVHNSDGNAVTDGENATAARQFYLKLARRLMHLFNTRTASGILYELDTRLRPEGNSGLLAINIESYYEYQRTQAWTWEHQAIVRARLIYGHNNLKTRFGEIRHEILSLPRDETKLKTDVIEMREKMRQHLAKDTLESFDLKQGLGGMTDIEFMAQYLVLKYASTFPMLTTYTDNIRIFEQAFVAGIIEESMQTNLTQAYCLFRDTYHVLSLNNQSRCVEKQQFEQATAHVVEAWQWVFA